MTQKSIENLTGKTLWLRLNNGDHLCLAPLAVSTGISATLLDANAGAEKMEKGGAIRLQDLADRAEGGEAAGALEDSLHREAESRKRKRDQSPGQPIN
jgi:hypothetical protein